MYTVKTNWLNDIPFVHLTKPSFFRFNNNNISDNLRGYYARGTNRLRIDGSSRYVSDVALLRGRRIIVNEMIFRTCYYTTRNENDFSNFPRRKKITENPSRFRSNPLGRGIHITWRRTYCTTYAGYLVTDSAINLRHYCVLSYGGELNGRYPSVWSDRFARAKRLRRARFDNYHTWAYDNWFLITTTGIGVR